MILQSKILKTKKRLSDDVHLVVVISFALSLLAIVASFAFRTVALQFPYGVVYSTIPAVVADHAASNSSMNEKSEIVNLDDNSILIVFTTRAFTFGLAKNFGENVYETDNKIDVPHEEGTPRLDKLEHALERWSNLSKRTAPANEVVVLAVEPIVPMPVVLQVVDFLQAKVGYRSVVLSPGFI